MEAVVGLRRVGFKLFLIRPDHTREVFSRGKAPERGLELAGHPSESNYTLWTW